MGGLRMFDDAGAFREAAEPELLENEPAHNLMFGVMHSIDAGRFDQPLMFTFQRPGRPTIVGLQTPPWELVISRCAAGDARALADELIAAGIDVPGINGLEGTAEVFAERWNERSGGAALLKMSMTIYAVERVTPPRGVPGRLRPATHDDTQFLPGWIRAFAAEALGGDATSDPDELLARRLGDPTGGLDLWIDDEERVSMAGFGGPTPNGIRIGPVYTPPERRGRGYAAALCAAQAQRLLDEGRRFCFLYADRTNPTSNGVYTRIGYRPVCDASVYRFVTETVPSTETPEHTA